MECFKTFSQEMASFYAVRKPLFERPEETDKKV